MRILLVSNEYPKPDRAGNPIICRLQDALKADKRVTDVAFSPFTNRLSDFHLIRKAAKKVDVIHIQFGGLYALMIWIYLIGIRKPKLLTFHGTDIHAKAIRTTKSLPSKIKIWLNQKASFISILLFHKLGFVSDTLIPYIPKWIHCLFRNKFFIQPLGVDYSLFTPISKYDALEKLGMEDYKYVLFSDISGTPIKRRDIAESIVSRLGRDYRLLIMCKVKPDTVPIYLNACDFVLLTSDEEGSPNITREALSLDKPVFSVDVGDVKQQIEGLHNSAIISRDPEEAARVIIDKLSEPYVDNTRERLKSAIDFVRIANKMVDIYAGLIN